MNSVMAVGSVPHIRYPFRIAGGSVLTVEQDTFDEVAQCVQVILTTPVGGREEVPTFGVEDPIFTTLSDPNAQRMLNAVNKFEPRARAALDVTVDNVDDFVHHIRVELPDRPDDLRADALPHPETAVLDTEGYGIGGWGIEPWGS